MATNMEQIAAIAHEMEADLDRLIALTEETEEAEEPGAEEEQPEPDDTGDIFGGPVGNFNGRKQKVIEGKDLRNQGQDVLTPMKDVDLVECDLPTVYGSVGPNVRLIRCKQRGLKGVTQGGHGGHLLYLNNGHTEKPTNLVISGHLIEDCEADNWYEGKLSYVVIENCEQRANVGQTIRQRHGTKGIFRHNKGFKRISVRGWLHYIQDCPGASVEFWAGTMPSRYSQWEKMHEAGGGFNMQRTELGYAEGVGSVLVGKPSGAKPESWKFPALHNIIDPGMEGKISMKHAEETVKEHLDGYKELWALA